MTRLSPSLTRRQKAVLDAVRRFSAEWGYMPSIAELARCLGSSKSTAHFHIVSLTRKGLLSHDGSDHGLRLLAAAEAVATLPARAAAVAIPVVGTIAAGAPLEAFEEYDEEVLVPPEMAREDGELYALRVRGRSMIEDGIYDRDLVIVRRQNSVRDGEVAVALLPDGSATLKRVYRESGRIRLQPANATMAPIFAREVRIQGKVVGLLRVYSA